MLLGLVRERAGLAAQVLGELGVTEGRAREHVVRIVGRGDTPSRGRLPFTPRAMAALRVAETERLALDHDAIETEHILLGAETSVVTRACFRRSDNAVTHTGTLIAASALAPNDGVAPRPSRSPLRGSLRLGLTALPGPPLRLRGSAARSGITPAPQTPWEVYSTRGTLYAPGAEAPKTS